MQLGGHAYFLMSFYLESCTSIYPDAMSQWIQQWVCIKFCANLGKSLMESLAMIRQMFGKKAWAIHGKSNDIKGTVHTEFVLAGQTVNSANYCDVLLWLCEDFVPNFGKKRTACCIMMTHYLTLPYSPGNFWPTTTWLLSSTHTTRLTWPLASFLHIPSLR
jgi:hypothetical protein